MLVNKCLRGLAPPYLAELCRPVVHLTGKLDVQRTATAIGRRNFAVSGPETWNSLPAELSTLSTATLHDAWKHISSSALILLKAAVVINIIIIIIIIIIINIYYYYFFFIFFYPRYQWSRGIWKKS